MIELVESVTSFLSLGYKKKEVLHVLLANLFFLLQGDFDKFLDESVINIQVIQKHEIQFENFFMLDIVPSHFIES